MLESGYTGVVIERTCTVPNNFLPTEEQIEAALEFFKMETFPDDGFLAATAVYAIERIQELQAQIEI